MERIGVYFRLLPNKREEYKRRHDKIWPEMRSVLTKAGVRNYSIWNYEEKLFGYMEVDDWKQTQNFLSQNPTYNKWRTYMEDIIEVDPKTGEKEFSMDLIFYHE